MKDMRERQLNIIAEVAYNHLSDETADSAVEQGIGSVDIEQPGPDDIFNLLFANIRSIRNKMDEIELMISKHSPSVIVLNETWLQENECEFYKIKGYVGVFNCRSAETRGGGTAIYIRDTVKHKLIYEAIKFNLIIVEIPVNNQRLKLCTFYRSPTFDPINEFIDEIDKILTEHSNMIVMADTNIDLLDESSTSTGLYKYIVESNNYKILNKIEYSAATRISNYRRHQNIN
jgi:hypothetical protein